MLKTKDIADFFGISTRTVINIIESGQLPAYKVGRQYSIKEEDFEAFKESAKIGGFPNKNYDVSRETLEEIEGGNKNEQN